MHTRSVTRDTKDTTSDTIIPLDADNDHDLDDPVDDDDLELDAIYLYQAAVLGAGVAQDNADELETTDGVFQFL